MHRKSYIPDQCPDQCAKHSAQYRKHDLSEGQLNRLSSSAREMIGTETGTAKRCSYSGCVSIEKYTHSIRLGKLDSGVLGDGWNSAEYP
jgi:hypothetical protein